MRLVALEDDGRRHGGETAFARRQRTGAAGARVEDAHAAIVHEPEPVGDDAGRHAQRMGHRNRVAVGVEGADMGRILRFRHLVQPLDMGFLARPDRGGQRTRIAFVEQFVERYVHEQRIADPVVLVDRGVFHRLADDADIFRRIVAHARQIEILQNVEHLQDHDPAARRLVAGNAVVAIVRPQRFGPDGLVVFEVLVGEQSAVRSHVGGDLLGHLAGIEDIGATFRDAAQGVRHIRVLEYAADLLKLVIFIEIDAAAGWSRTHFVAAGDTTVIVLLGPVTIDIRPDDEAILGIFDGWRADVFPVHRAVLFDSLIIGLQAARDHDRLVADLVNPVLQEEAETVAGFADDQIFPHIFAYRCRRAGVEVDESVKPLLRQVEMHGAESGNAAHLRVDDVLHQRAGDRGVDGVATLHHDDGAGLDRLGLGCRDNSARHVRLALPSEREAEYAAAHHAVQSGLGG